MSEILVTGGTGHLGRELVPRLLAKDHAVKVLSRCQTPGLPAGARGVRGDLVSGTGLDEALAGAEIIVHCASGTGTIRSLTYRSARRTDVEATERLLTRAKAGGFMPYVLYISIVGIDRIPLGYYRAKHETEGVIEASGLPYTVLRTTQWHTLAWELCRRLTRFPVAAVPKGLKAQLLDPVEVADRMVALLDGGPVGRADDMGGPHILDLQYVVRSYLKAVGKRGTLVSFPFPGRTVAAFQAGYNWTPEHADGRITWDEWLTKRASADT